ncbi:MAG: hypothetical protein J6H18_04250 [Lachnospiraceae bacterium]|nr:hypothetical protein [Lachnospiraceae bacterium]
MKEDLILCGAGGSRQKFYLNPRYETLPEEIRLELKAALALFAEQVGGTILLVYSETGSLSIRLIPDEGDFYYDEIEAGLAVSRLQKEKEELFQKLELYYRLFFGGRR